MCQKDIGANECLNFQIEPILLSERQDSVSLTARHVQDTLQHRLNYIRAHS